MDEIGFVKIILFKVFNIKQMMLILLFLFVLSVQGYNYDWDRLHQCSNVQILRETVFDYRENFPCLDCREHFQSLLEIHPFPLDYVRTSEDVRVWTWLTHNLVNIRLNKTWESFDIMDECRT